MRGVCPPALEDLYASESGPADRPCVFDVHHERPGGTFENVDLVAVHWRSNKIAEIVSVEVKLDFTSRLVQQANNYRRFSDRVWISVPVQAELGQAAAELRAMDERLFDHVVDLGLGVLACRRRQGRSYEVVPIHWPVRNVPEPLEREMFVEWHRGLLEDAGAVAPRASGDYPR